MSWVWESVRDVQTNWAALDCKVGRIQNTNFDDILPVSYYCQDFLQHIFYKLKCGSRIHVIITFSSKNLTKFLCEGIYQKLGN